MKIVYNPPNGKPIGEGYNNFIYEGTIIEAHLPGDLKQYEDKKAVDLIDIFAFLEEIKDPKKAAELANRPKEGKFKCEYCGFSTDTKVALFGHMKTHGEEIKKAAEPAIDPSIVPVASGKKVTVNLSGRTSEDIPDGVDKDGVPWYGGGVKEERSFKDLNQNGEGKFGRQKLIE